MMDDIPLVVMVFMFPRYWYGWWWLINWSMVPGPLLLRLLKPTEYEEEEELHAANIFFRALASRTRLLSSVF
jgi:hypothetical protein